MREAGKSSRVDDVCDEPRDECRYDKIRNTISRLDKASHIHTHRQQAIYAPLCRLITGFDRDGVGRDIGAR